MGIFGQTIEIHGFSKELDCRHGSLLLDIEVKQRKIQNRTVREIAEDAPLKKNKHVRRYEAAGH